MTRRRVIIAGSVVVVLIAGIAISRASRHTPVTSSADDIPIATVKRGELDLRVYTTGEIEAKNSVTLSAPPVAGASLQITHLLHTGAVVRKGDVVIEFDPTEQHYVLEQSRSELHEAEQDILKAKSDAAVQRAQDDVALLKARFDVRQAELEVQKNELVSTIDAQKNKLALDQTKRALAELEQDIKSHATTGQTGIDLAQEKWKKAKLSMEVAQQNIDKMRVTAPTDGLVSIEKNISGEFFFSGMALPDFHEGDQVQPGTQSPDCQRSFDRRIGGRLIHLLTGGPYYCGDEDYTCAVDTPQRGRGQCGLQEHTACGSGARNVPAPI